MIRLVVPIEISLLPSIIGMFSLAWIAGYLVFFAPGGLGVSDLSLSLLLASIMPPPIAIVVSLSFRFLVFVAEAVVLFGTWLLNKK